jgi:hypothetical protein
LSQQLNPPYHSLISAWRQSWLNRPCAGVARDRLKRPENDVALVMQRRSLSNGFYIIARLNQSTWRSAGSPRRK